MGIFTSSRGGQGMINAYQTNSRAELPDLSQMINVATISGRQASSRGSTAKEEKSKYADLEGLPMAVATFQLADQSLDSAQNAIMNTAFNAYSTHSGDLQSFIQTPMWQETRNDLAQIDTARTRLWAYTSQMKKDLEYANKLRENKDYMQGRSLMMGEGNQMLAYGRNKTTGALGWDTPNNLEQIYNNATTIKHISENAGFNQVVFGTPYSADKARDELKEKFGMVYKQLNSAEVSADQTGVRQEDGSVATQGLLERYSSNIGALVNFSRNYLEQSGDEAKMSLFNDALSNSQTFSYENPITKERVHAKGLIRNEYSAREITDEKGNGTGKYEIVAGAVMGETGVFEVIDPHENPQEAMEEMVRRQSMQLMAGAESIDYKTHAGLKDVKPYEPTRLHFFTAVGTGNYSLANATVKIKTDGFMKSPDLAGDMKKLSIGTELSTEAGKEFERRIRDIQLKHKNDPAMIEWAKDYEKNADKMADYIYKKALEAGITPGQMGVYVDPNAPPTKDKTAAVAEQVHNAVIAMRAAGVWPRPNTNKISVTPISEKAWSYMIYTGQALIEIPVPEHAAAHFDTHVGRGHIGEIAFPGNNKATTHAIFGTDTALSIRSAGKMYAPMAFERADGSIRISPGMLVDVMLTKDQYDKLTIQELTRNDEIKEVKYKKYGIGREVSSSSMSKEWQSQYEKTHGVLPGTIYIVQAIVPINQWNEYGELYGEPDKNPGETVQALRKEKAIEEQIANEVKKSLETTVKTEQK